MGFQGLWRSSLLKPRNFFLTLAALAMLLYLFGLYNQVLPDSSFQAKIRPLINLSNIVFDNIPIADIFSLYFDHEHYGKGYINKPIYVDQFESKVALLKYTVKLAPEGSLEQKQAKQNLDNEISHRKHVECAIKEIVKHFFDDENYQEMIIITHSSPEDWDCYKTMPTAYMEHCGKLYTSYGFQFMHVFANMCNAGLQRHQVAEVASQVCSNKCSLGHFGLA